MNISIETKPQKEKLKLTASNLNEIFDVNISAVIHNSTEIILRKRFWSEKTESINNYKMKSLKKQK